jgi:hypothetical protein
VGVPAVGIGQPGGAAQRDARRDDECDDDRGEDQRQPACDGQVADDGFHVDSSWGAMDRSMRIGLQALSVDGSPRLYAGVHPPHRRACRAAEGTGLEFVPKGAACCPVTRVTARAGLPACDEKRPRLLQGHKTVSAGCRQVPSCDP